MRFTAKAKDLKACLSMARRAMESKPSQPLLNAVRVVVDAGTVAIIGTDLHTTIGSEVDAIDTSSGEVGIYWHSLKNVLPDKPTASDSIEVLADNGEVIIKSGGIEHKMESVDISELPPIPSIPIQHTINIAEWIKICSKFTSREDTRASINGVHVNRTESATDIVATDGKVLKLIRIPGEYSEEEQFHFTLHNRPAYAVKVKFRGDVGIGFDDEHEMLRISGSKGEMITSLRLPKYPDYDMVLAPAKASVTDGDAVELTLDRHELMDKIKRICKPTLKSRKHSPPDRQLYFIMHEGVIELRHVIKADDWNALDNISALSADNKDLTFAVDPRLMMTTLENIDCSGVTFYVVPNNAKNTTGVEKVSSIMPLLIVPAQVNEDYQDWTVLMPMRAYNSHFEQSEEKEAA